MGIPAPFIRVIAPFCPLLAAITCYHCEIYVKGIIIQLYLAEKPLAYFVEQSLVYGDGKLVKITLVSLMAGHLLKTKYFAQNIIKADYLQVLKTIGSTPHTD